MKWVEVTTPLGQRRLMSAAAYAALPDFVLAYSRAHFVSRLQVIRERAAAMGARR